MEVRFGTRFVLMEFAVNKLVVVQALLRVLRFALSVLLYQSSILINPYITDAI